MTRASNEPLPLNEHAEVAGEWWAPARPGVVAYGRLIYSPDEGLELDLASGSDVIGLNEPVPWIHGLTVQGRRVTLRNCFARSWTMTIPGGFAARVYAEQAFVGMHAAAPVELSMLSLSARILSLSEWLGRSGLAVTGFGGKPKQISYSHPAHIPLAMVERALLFASFELTGEAIPATKPSVLNLEEQSWLNLNPRRSRPFDDLRVLVDRFNALLSFASGIDCPLLELVGEAIVSVEEIGPGRVHRQKTPVWVLYNRVVASPSRAQVARRMLFTYDDAQSLGKRPIHRWFRRSRQLEPVTNLYLSALPSRPYIWSTASLHMFRRSRGITVEVLEERLSRETIGRARQRPPSPSPQARPC